MSGELSFLPLRGGSCPLPYRDGTNPYLILGRDQIGYSAFPNQPKSYQAKCIALDALPNPSKSGKYSSLCEGGLTTKGYPEGKTPSGLISPRGNV